MPVNQSRSDDPTSLSSESLHSWRFWMIMLLMLNGFVLVAALWRNFDWQASPPIQVNSPGLRSDALQVEKPWESNSNLLAVPTPTGKTFQSINLEEGRSQLNSALNQAEKKVQEEVKPLEFCQLWGPLLPDQKTRVQGLLAKWPGKVEAVERKDSLGYIVIIPRAVVQQGLNVAELNKKGLKDLFVIGAVGPFQGAISAGIFRTKDRADAQLQFLVSKGIRGAEVRERPGPLRTFYRLTGSADQIKTLGNLYEANPRGELKACDTSEQP